MIIHDDISRAATVSAVLICVLLAVFQTTTIILFPGFLILMGLALEYILERSGTGFRKSDTPDKGTDRKELTSIMYYAILGIFGLMLTGFVLDFFLESQIIAGQLVDSPLSFKLGITSFDVILYSGLMAVSEEIFFRGGFLDFLLSYRSKDQEKTSIGKTVKGFFSISKIPVVALVLSAIGFMIYHTYRYSASVNSMLYVLAGGFFLSWISWKSERLSPAIIAHVANNVIATVGAGVLWT